jgi:N-acetylneuraminate lyase
MPKFGGSFPALVTPFTQDDEVNVSVLKDVVEYLIAKNVSGFYVGGTTGEGIFMSVAERKQVTETVVGQVNGRATVLVHVGCVSVKDAVELAQHAARVGADGVSSILVPHYNSLDSLDAYFSQIGAAVPQMPLFGYMFGGSVDAVTLMRRLMEIPNFVGAKYTGSNMFELRQVITLTKENWTIYSGMDEQCLFAAMAGAHGNVGSTLNFMPGVYREMRACAASGDYERGLSLQHRANEITRIMLADGFPGALKAVMAKLGFDCGAPRLPNLPLPRERWKWLSDELEAAGFSELVKM